MTIVKANPNCVPGAVAVRCGWKNCTQEFILEKRDNPGSYSLAAYDRHLQDVHKFSRPKPIIILKDWSVKQR